MKVQTIINRVKIASAIIHYYPVFISGINTCWSEILKREGLTCHAETTHGPAAGPHQNSQGWRNKTRSGWILRAGAKLENVNEWWVYKWHWCNPRLIFQVMTGRDSRNTRLLHGAPPFSLIWYWSSPGEVYTTNSTVSFTMPNTFLLISLIHTLWVHCQI